MDSTKFVDAMGEISEKHIKEAVAYRPKSNTSHYVRQHFSTIMIAAILALLLMGAGLAAEIFGDSIQSRFGHHWQIITGQAMDNSQITVLNHLSQNIGLSQTVNGVKVTVDSAVVGDDSFSLLIRAEGVNFSNRHGCEFESYTIKVTPDPLLNPDAMGTFGFTYRGLDGDGTALFLMNYNFTSTKNFTEDTSPLEIELNLKNLYHGMELGKHKLLAEGDWNFTFSIDRSQFPEPIHLPDTRAMIFDSHIKEMVEIAFSNIEVTCTGIRFQYDKNGTTSDFDLTEINAILANGIPVGCSDGNGIQSENGVTFYFSGHWHTPISLDEVSAIKLGETQILVPSVN